MATPSAAETSRRPGVADKCLARSMVESLAVEPALEAVTIDRAHQKISVATLGRADLGELTERVTREMQAAQAVSAGHQCSLLIGQGDCATCDIPLPEDARKKITTHTEGAAATIARVTCPTAPKFWRWRDLPFPKIVQRDVEFLEHADEHDHADEWKIQLALAIACGVCGLLAAFVVPAAWRIPVFALSYLAGAWFPARKSGNAFRNARSTCIF